MLFFQRKIRIFLLLEKFLGNYVLLKFCFIIFGRRGVWIIRKNF
jgi:hypothetical protein